MKIRPHKIAVFFLILFVNTVLFAQEKKQKNIVSPNNNKEITEKKHKRLDSLRQENRVPVKKHRLDSPKKEKPDTRKQKSGDSGKRNPWQNVRSKKIVMDIPCPPAATVFLKNMMQKVNILTSNNNKVTLVTTVYYQGESSLTDSQWFSKLKLSLTANENNIEVKSGDFPISSTQEKEYSAPKLDTIFNGVTVFDSLGNATARRSHSDRNIVLYLPRGIQVNVESKYADITFENNMGVINARMNNGRLNLMDAEQLHTTSTYARIYAENIKQADVDLTNGSLKAKQINTLSIASKNSLLALKKVDVLTISSSHADQFNIEEAKTISGQKAYGDLQLTTLTGSLDLSGVNADMKIKRINPSVEAIKINTQYADLQIPVGQLQNYEVQFEGIGGNVYTPFEKKHVTQTTFNAKVGSGKTATAFYLKCNNCTVAFK